MISGIFDTACQQGFLYAIAIFGIVISFRILNWPDLTVDGSFTLGGAVSATLIVSKINPALTIVFAGLAGYLAGTITVFLNRKLGISKILSGILVMIVLYSINLRIMGRANISLLRIPTVFSQFDTKGPGDTARIITFFSISVLFFIVLCYLSLTRIGLYLRATGDNEFMVQCQGVNTDGPYYVGIGLSNALVSISGAFVAQNQGFTDVNMGTGVIMIGIAALIIGETFYSGISVIFTKIYHKFFNDVKNSFSFWGVLPWETFGEFFAGFFGAFLYFLILAICLRLGLASTDLKLATGILVIIGIALRFKGPTVETYNKGKF